MSKKGIAYDFLVEFAKVLTGENNWSKFLGMKIFRNAFFIHSMIEEEN